MKILRAHWALALLVLVFIGLATYYSITTPILESPDEVWHYHFVREVAVNHGLPVVDPSLNQPFRHEGLQAPLYYVLGAPLIAWMNPADLEKLPALNPYVRIGEPAAGTNDNRNMFLHTPDEAFPYHGAALAVHLLRLYSVLLGALTVVLTYLLGRELFLPSGEATDEERVGSERIGLLGAAFVAFLPQFLFINGAINNDNLANTLSAAALWLLVRLWRRGLTVPRGLVLGLVVGAALLTKVSTAALAPLVLLVMVAWALQKREWRTGILAGAGFVMVTAALAGWWYVRNKVLYGDFSPITPLALLAPPRPSTLDWWRWFSAESEGLRLSAWGVFGWFNIRASSSFYLLFDALALLGLLGIVFALLRRQRVSPAAVILPIWFIFCLVALGEYSSYIVSTQGRLLFTALSGWAVLWAWGVLSLAPDRWQPYIGGALSALLLAVALVTPSAFIAPAYAPDRIAENQLPANSQPLGWKFENGVEWLAARVDGDTVAPGQTLRVTLYERLPRATPLQDVIFIHVLNSADVIVAQRDSYAGAGNASTLADGATIADTFDIPIPVTAATHDARSWRIEAGLYEPTSGRRLAATDPGGHAIGAAPILTQLAVKPPVASAWKFDFSGQAILSGIDYGAESVAAGQTLQLTLHWRGARSDSKNHVFVHVLGEQDHIWGAADTPIAGTTQSQIDLTIDPATPPGVYPLELGVYPAPDGDRLGIFDLNGQDLGDHLLVGPIRVTPAP